MQDLEIVYIARDEVSTIVYITRDEASIIVQLIAFGELQSEGGLEVEVWEVCSQTGKKADLCSSILLNLPTSRRLVGLTKLAISCM